MDESHDDFMESHADFIARFRKMSSAAYRPEGIENPRAARAAKMNAQNQRTARADQRSHVLCLLALGKRDAQIADELGIAEDTVRTLRISRM